MNEKAPSKRYFAGNIRVSVWENKSEKSNASYYTIRISRVFKDKNNAWKNANSFRVSDIPKVIMLLTKVYSELAILEEEQASG